MEERSEIREKKNRRKAKRKRQLRELEKEEEEESKEKVKEIVDTKDLIVVGYTKNCSKCGVVKAIAWRCPHCERKIVGKPIYENKK